MQLSQLFPVGPHDQQSQPSVPRGQLHSGKGMEMIHSGNCDCPFPGRGCVWEVPAAFPGQPHPPSRPGRTALPRGSAGSRRDRSPEQRRKRQVRRAAPGQPSTCGRRRRPGGRSAAPQLPAPPRSLLQPNFLFAASRPRLTSRAGKPPKAASFSETPPSARLRPLHLRIPPRPGSPRGAGAGAGAAAAGSQRCRRASRRAGPGPAPRRQRALRGGRGGARRAASVRRQGSALSPAASWRVRV